MRLLHPHVRFESSGPWVGVVCQAGPVICVLPLQESVRIALATGKLSLAAVVGVLFRAGLWFLGLIGSTSPVLSLVGMLELRCDILAGVSC
jgi:hypothetical protein